MCLPSTSTQITRCRPSKLIFVCVISEVAICPYLKLGGKILFLLLYLSVQLTSPGATLIWPSYEASFRVLENVALVGLSGLVEGKGQHF